MIPTLAIAFPAIDPILVEFGPLAIRWYSLSYVVGIIMGWWMLFKINRLQPPALPAKAMDDIMIWAIMGIILGGRLGYVLFYNAEFYFSNPVEIVKIWQGGMSFHGGLIGVITAIYLLCRHHRIAFWPVIDLAAVVTPIGLFLGRIANFINGELYGRITDVPWAVIFPSDPFSRHPSQLYEAALEGLLLFIIMFIAVHKNSIRQRPGMLSGMFLVGYAAARSFVELYREPDAHIGFLYGHITMGHLLSFPMIIFGLYLVLRPKKKRTS